MKKFMSMVIALALSASMTAYADTAETTTGETGNTAAVAENETVPSENFDIQCEGSWETVKGDTSIKGNPDAKAAFDKAAACLAGASYEPVAVLAKQVYGAVWCDGTDSYSFYVKKGVSAKTAKKLAAALIAENSR